MGKRYSPEMKLEIEECVIDLYAKGYRKKGMLEIMTKGGFRAPDGLDGIKPSTINNYMERLKKSGRMVMDNNSEPEETEPADIEIDLPQLVIDCLISDELNNDQKVNMVRGYYEL